MGLFSRKPAEDPRDTVGNNPTGRARKSSARARRKASRRVERDLKGTQWEKPEEDE